MIISVTTFVNIDDIDAHVFGRANATRRTYDISSHGCTNVPALTNIPQPQHPHQQAAVTTGLLYFEQGIL